MDLLDSYNRLSGQGAKLRQTATEDWARFTRLVLIAGRDELAKRIEAYEARSGTAILSAADSPKFAEFLLTMLLKPSHVDGVLGDLKEHFESECRRLGRRRAVWRYWRRTIDSLWPLLWRAMGKALKWGALIATLRRFF